MFIQSSLSVSLCFAILFCSSSCAQKASWNPDTKRLDSLEQLGDPDLMDLVETVKQFYESLRDKDWETTYSYRTSAFKNDVSRSFYRQSMQKREDRWGLLHYEVMSVDVFVNSSGEKQVRLVIRVIQSPLSHENVAVVWWKMEDSGWKSEESGADLLPLSRRFSAPREEENNLRHFWSDRSDNKSGPVVGAEGVPRINK